MHTYVLISDGGSNSLDGEGDCEHSDGLLSSNESNYKARMHRLQIMDANAYCPCYIVLLVFTVT